MKEWILPLLAGGAAGVLSGFGVGGGTLLLVYLTVVAGVDQHQAQGINLLFFLPAALLALPAHLKNGYVERKALLPAILTGLVAAGAAAWLATSLDGGILRKCFGVLLLVVGAGEFFGRREEAETDK